MGGDAELRGGEGLLAVLLYNMSASSTTASPGRGKCDRRQERLIAPLSSKHECERRENHLEGVVCTERIDHLQRRIRMRVISRVQKCVQGAAQTQSVMCSVALTQATRV
jgi:hypothetical protein